MKFEQISKKITSFFGSVWAFMGALSLVIGWFLGGVFIYGFGEFSQLFINSVTTVITFLTVFSIQNAQNHDSKALHLKLDELIRSKQHADNNIINIESLTDDQLNVLHDKYLRIAKEHRSHLNKT